MKICFIIAPEEFRDEEYFEPKKVFEDNNVEVITASKDTKIAKGVLGGEQEIDIDYSNINVDDYDAILFCGGGGAQQFIEDEICYKIIKETFEKDKIIAAICLAPAILAKSGILKGKKATCWAGAKHYLVEGDAQYTEKGCEVNGKIITADGPKTAKLFGEKIVEKLNI